MTARARLLALRRALLAAMVVRALSVGTAVALLVLVAGRLANNDQHGVEVSLAAGVAAAAWLARSLPRARSLECVALWVEEAQPELRYAVVSLAAGVADVALEAQALALPWWNPARRRLVRALAWPAAMLLLAVALLLGVPESSRARDIARYDRSATLRTHAVHDPLVRLRATVTPPAYSGRPRAVVNDPAGIDALVGSVVTLAGDGDAGAVMAMIDSTARSVAPREGGWSVTFGMPARPALLRIRRRDGHSGERLVVLAPVVDAPPSVVLLLPERDTVMRVANGILELRAAMRDDIGLRDARFELVVSSGQEEHFTFRTTLIASTRLGNATGHTLDARVSLDSLALKPGDVLQLRAVARDANTATGPGVGSSETRSLRVARSGEFDSLGVAAAAPGDPEAQLPGQRLLIMLTEALERRRRGLSRGILLAESARIAADQARLRRRVGDVVFQRLGGEPLGEESVGASAGEKVSPGELLKRAEEATRASAAAMMDVEGDETPTVAVNRPLLEAFNAMWDAGRALDQGETDRALPPMRRALAAIERARQAERIYLRGRPSAVVVDIARARLAGKEHGASSAREPRVPDDPPDRRRAESFAHATALLARDPGAAADTLLVMRVDALEAAPALAVVLDAAARAVRGGGAAAIADAWRRVRRALGAAPVHGEAAALWSGAP